MIFSERFFYRGTLLTLFVGALLVIAIPTVAQIIFYDFLPESLRFDHWPFWLKAPFILAAASYFIAEFWLILNPQNEKNRQGPEKSDEAQNDSTK